MLPPAMCGYYTLEMGQMEMRHEMSVKDKPDFRLSVEKYNNFINVLLIKLSVIY